MAVVIFKLPWFHCVFLFLFLAIQASIIAKESFGEWIRYTVNIISIYKRDPNQNMRGEAYVFVAKRDHKCKCPKLRLGRRYLLVGRHHSKNSHRPGYQVDRKTTVIRWRDKYQKRMRKFMQYERRFKCGNASRKKRHWCYKGRKGCRVLQGEIMWHRHINVEYSL